MRLPVIGFLFTILLISELPRCSGADYAPGVHRYAVFGFDVLGTPRWNSRTKVSGFSVTVETGAPKGVNSYDVCLYVQFKRGKEDWRYVPAAPTTYGAVYKAKESGVVAERIRVEGDHATVQFFIPHRVLHLAKGVVDLQFVVQFLKDNEPVKDLTKTIIPIRATVTEVNGPLVVRAFYAKPAPPPVKIWDVEKKEWMRVVPRDKSKDT